MAKRTTSANILLFGVLTLMAVGSWVAFEVIRGLTNTTLTQVQQQQIQPLKIAAGEELVRTLSARRGFDEATLRLVVSRAVPGADGEPIASRAAEARPTPTPESEVTEEASNEAELEGETATEGGTTQ